MRYSGRRRAHQDTLLLYWIPREEPKDKPQQTGENAEPAAKEPVGIGPDTVTIPKPGLFRRFFGRNGASWLGWKAGLATALGIVLGVAVWKATHPTAFPDGVNLGASAEVFQLAPTIVPLASPDAMPEPAAMVPQPVGRESEASLETPALVSDDKKPHRIRDATLASSARTRVFAQEGTVSKPGKSVVQEPPRAESNLSTPPASSATGSSVRAGSLSADDF